MAKSESEQLAELKAKLLAIIDEYKVVSKEKAKEFGKAATENTFDVLTTSASSTTTKSKNLPQIQNSVGDKGLNSPVDVLIVWSLLNKQGANIKETGACDKDMIAAIREFQKKIGLKNWDGLISPDGETWKKLYAGKNNDELQIPTEDKKKYKYKKFVLQLFVKGKGDANNIDPNDVKQGLLSNCYFIASLHAIAKTNPEAIRNLIKDNGDGSYAVTLYAKGDKVALKPQVITVKPQFPVQDDGKTPAYARQGDNEMWVMIVEKAFAKMMGSYENIEYDSAELAMETITGKDATTLLVKYADAVKILTLITIALNENIPIVAGTHTGKASNFVKSGDKVYQGHVYTVVAFDGSIIKLHNPWAEQHVRITIDEFKQLYASITFQTTDIRFNFSSFEQKK